jgi:ribose transport system substrate-binding protein
MVRISKRRFLQLSSIGAVAAVAGDLPIIGARAEGKRYVVGLAMNGIGHPFSQRMMNGNKDYAAKNYPDVDILITDGNSQSIKQVQDVESLVARGVDALMISPFADEPLTPAVKAAMAKGVPVITLDRTVSTPVTCKIGGNNRKIGVEVGKFVAQRVGADAKIIEVQGTAGASATIERGDGFKEGLAGAGKVVAAQNCDYFRAPAVKFMEDMTNRFGEGEFNVVYAHNDAMALGAIQVLRERSRLKGVTVVSIDGENAAFNEVAAGGMTATWIYPPCAPEGIKAAYAIVTKQPFEAVQVLPTVGVTADNVKQYIGTGI